MGNSIPNSYVFEKFFDLLNLKNYRCPFADSYAKKLYTGQAILLMVDAYLRKAIDLDYVTGDLAANKALQDYLQLESIDSATLYRKIEKLPTDLLQSIALETFMHLHDIHLEKEGIPRLGKLKIVDSSEVTLPERAKWAYVSENKNSVKLHLELAVIDKETMYPTRMVLSTAVVSDQEAAKHLVQLDPDEGWTYLFDRGYLNYSLYRDWVQRDIAFAARVKSNSKLHIVKEFPIPKNTRIIKDAEVEVLDKVSGETFKLRLVEYKDNKKKLYRIVTNRWDLSAEDVAELYKRRWIIELFFRSLKGQMNLKKTYNNKPAAVWNQIYISLIAHCLKEIMHKEIDAKKKPSQMLKDIRLYWRNPWIDFIKALSRKPTRTSAGRQKKATRGRPRIHPKKYRAQYIIIYW